MPDPRRSPYWSDTVPQTDYPRVTDDLSCDLAIVGGGFTGLWSALKASERNPDARIVVLEAARCGDGASSRNGGFCAPSISHGVSNAVTRWPDEAGTLIRLGRENLDDLEADLAHYDIDAEFHRSGKINVAATPWQVEGLRAMQAACARHGVETRFFEGRALHDYCDSPAYSAGLFEPNYALVNPARLVAGLARACTARGVQIFENSQASGIASQADGVRIDTARGCIRAKRTILATNAFQPLLLRLRSTIIPIFDYALMTRPLTDAQLAEIGWQGRHGIADSGNQFHYSRKTADNRILWGGFDAVYHYGSRRDAALYDRPESFDRLKANFHAVFPSLDGIGFSHAWGGVIDTSARTTFFAGQALNGRVAYALGFTGQGVSASRFAALTMLDLLDGTRTERTNLRMLRQTPVPFPPEPFRSLAVRAAQAGLAHEDLTGKRSGFLRTLDRFGVGFDS